MEIMYYVKIVAEVLLGLFALSMVLSSFTTVAQGHVGIVQRFGKFSRILRPGLSWLVPLIDDVAITFSMQQYAEKFEFEVITQDQAQVGFTITILFEPFNESEENIKRIAYRFTTKEMFQRAVEGAVEASIRSTVADKKQAEILGMRTDLVKAIKEDLDQQLESWGWHLRDTQINKIGFDDSIMKSMSRVVAAKNQLSAAEFEGQALLVQKTKEAEAHGRAIEISAKSEAEAEKQRGIGLAWFRDEVARGIVESAEMLSAKHVGPEVMLFAMWNETLKYLAEVGKGNTFFFDGSLDNMQRTLRQLSTKLGDKV